MARPRPDRWKHSSCSVTTELKSWRHAVRTGVLFFTYGKTPWVRWRHPCCWPLRRIFIFLPLHSWHQLKWCGHPSGQSRSRSLKHVDLLDFGGGLSRCSFLVLDLGTLTQVLRTSISRRSSPPPDRILKEGTRCSFLPKNGGMDGWFFKSGQSRPRSLSSHSPMNFLHSTLLSSPPPSLSRRSRALGSGGKL